MVGVNAEAHENLPRAHCEIKFERPHQLLGSMLHVSYPTIRIEAGLGHVSVKALKVGEQYYVRVLDPLPEAETPAATEMLASLKDCTYDADQDLLPLALASYPDDLASDVPVVRTRYLGFRLEHILTGQRVSVSSPDRVLLSVR